MPFLSSLQQQNERYLEVNGTSVPEEPEPWPAEHRPWRTVRALAERLRR